MPIEIGSVRMKWLCGHEYILLDDRQGWGKEIAERRIAAKYVDVGQYSIITVITQEELERLEGVGYAVLTDDEQKDYDEMLTRTIDAKCSQPCKNLECDVR